MIVRHHAKNGPIHRKMVVDCPLVITSIVKIFFRSDKTRKKELMVQPVFCIVDAGSCYVLILVSKMALIVILVPKTLLILIIEGVDIDIGIEAGAGSRGLGGKQKSPTPHSQVPTPHCFLFCLAPLSYRS